MSECIFLSNFKCLKLHTYFKMRQLIDQVEELQTTIFFDKFVYLIQWDFCPTKKSKTKMFAVIPLCSSNVLPHTSKIVKIF